MPTPKRPTPQPALFDGDTSISDDTTGAPLAARLRPRDLDDYVGQEHLIGPNKLLRRLIESGQLPSIILWGPPGSGKTTLARIIARHSNARFEQLSAVAAGVADIRRVMAEARARKVAAARSLDADPAKTVLFIDEIHRFNKAQQDAVLPYVEDGTVTLIGATTENPSFEVIGPLLSRSRVFTLKALDETQIANLIQRALTDPDHGLGALNVRMDHDAIEALAASVGGDARIALNALEAAVMSVTPSAPTAPVTSTASPTEADPMLVPEPVEGRAPVTTSSTDSPNTNADSPTDSIGAVRERPRQRPEEPDADPVLVPGPVEGRAPITPSTNTTPYRHVTREVVEEALQHRTYLYDRQGDSHYDTISAFIKSLRGSDPDAALYWLARMIQAGEDPLFIVRRMVILASEDVGLADPQAMSIAAACQQAVHFIGMPEGFYPLAECALYLALAPKSNSVGTAYGKALADVERTRNDPVPMHLRNAVTGLMHQLGYGQNYKYAHNYYGGIAPDQTYLPDRLKGAKYYKPGTIGREAALAKALEERAEANKRPVRRVD